MSTSNMSWWTRSATQGRKASSWRCSSTSPSTSFARKRKRIALADLRALFVQAHPELQFDPERDRRLLDLLTDLAAGGAIQFPAAGSWERIGAPPMPKWVALPTDVRPVMSTDWSSVPW